MDVFYKSCFYLLLVISLYNAKYMPDGTERIFYDILVLLGSYVIID